MKHSTGKSSKEEISRFEKLKELGCIACILFMERGKKRGSVLTGRSAEVHHLLSGNRRRGHKYTIGLCGWHHRSVTVLPKRYAVLEYGPSLAEGPKLFHDFFGSDEELLARTNELLRAI